MVVINDSKCHNNKNNMYFINDFTNIFSVKILRGSEFSVVVHFSADINGSHAEEIYSRCKTRLFVICHTRNATKVFPTAEAQMNATKFMQKTDISGIY